ncbi:lysophospholipase [Clostridiaceae bacterium M8S5]|nr:lysophospholipase [Clostridiaceae bacterium M8S5]
MNINRFKLVNGDHNIECICWSDDNGKKIKGVVQIAHGMAEHIDRYDDFAKYLVRNGFIVYGNNHRGHGKEAIDNGTIGHFSDNDGWNSVVEDMFILNQEVSKHYSNLPIILFGHSMGSFLSRTYIYKYPKTVDIVVLSGTGYGAFSTTSLGKFISKLVILIKGKKEKSKLMNLLSFKGYNKSFSPVRTDFDWLSRDEKEVDKYVEDELCGEVFTAGFFYDLLSGLREIHKKKNIINIPKTIPILLISGDKDPVGNNSIGVNKVYQLYKKFGINNIEMKIYKNARHELLNETNKDEVYEYILKWINLNLSEIE